MVNVAPEATGEMFGPYEVYERLGVGGMATVYRAKKRGPEGFERSVALKRMLSHLAEDPTFVESFVREAKVASLLQHPNIAQVYDFGRISGVYYIAMELVGGFDMRKLLRYANRANEAIPMPVILSILGELCDALDYAHTFVDESGQPLNIVHRDVSPSNLIVAHTGHLKVIDFGIAKASSRSLHTESGQVKGKLGYMSPEVALGMQVGPVSDLFSLGVVAWELVTASPLFSARTDFETMRKIREEPIAPPSHLNPACPAKLDQIILAALERDERNRLPSARLFRKAVDEIAAQLSMQVSVRAVSEWMLKYAHPDDSWARAAARARSPSGHELPLADPPTAVLRTARAATQLRRSPDEVQLATEIWGEDARTVGSAARAPAPDFHVQVATPLPTQMPSGMLPPPLAPQPAPRRDRKLYVAFGALALVAAVLVGVLAARHTSGPTPVADVTATPVADVTAKPVADVTAKQEHERAAEVATAPAPAKHEGAMHDPETQDRADKPVAPKHVAVASKQGKRSKQKQESRHEVAELPPPAEDPPRLDPPKVEPPKVEPPKVEPPRPVETKPARTPVVAATAVTKLSGEVPTLHAKNAEGSGDVLAKMCIDDQGKVSSVKILKANPELAGELQGALASWRYKPFARDGKRTAVCFPLSLRVVVKGS